jgi:hypothetical protein
METHMKITTKALSVLKARSLLAEIPLLKTSLTSTFGRRKDIMEDSLQKRVGTHM